MAASRNRPPDRRLPESAAAVLAAAGVAPGQTVCVALSGGVDSVVLLDVLQRLVPDFGFALRAVHIHHGLSPNADAWQDFCERLCAARGLPLHALRVVVDRAHPEGLEAAARAVRLAALERMGGDWLAFGHHADDQAETVLFRVLRGAGVRGAAGMQAVEGRRLRPLLAVRRGEIRAYAASRGLHWVEDESNSDFRFARNRLRGEILPRVEASFSGAVATLGRAAENFREADELLGELAAADRAACGGESLSRVALVALSELRLRNLLRQAIRDAGCEAPERGRLIEAARQLREAGERPLRLATGDAAVCCYRDRVWVEPALVASGGEPPLVLSAEACRVRWGAGCVSLVPAVGEGIRREALQDAGEILLTRRWPGLAMRQGEGRPHRSFKNLCQEAGIPAWLRDGLPALRVDGAAAWIAEVGVAAEFRCRSGEAGLRPEWQPDCSSGRAGERR